jgi:methylenetetrahydrofolate reductase (NADPH)
VRHDDEYAVPLVLIRELIAAQGASYSFEFFPPKTPEAAEELWRVIRDDLAPLDPTFVSVTYGAGGSTRDRTIDLVIRIARETAVTPMAHLTTVGASPSHLHDVVTELAAGGVRNILALRGDPPRDAPDFVSPPDELTHAIDLVRLVRSHPAGDFCIGVAGFPEKHPDAPDFDTDVRHLVEKVKAGADFVITQFFFEARHYFRLVDAAYAAGLPESVPIIPGIMPVTNVRQITRFAQLSGAEFPAWLAERLNAVGDDPEAVRRVGVEEASKLCAELLERGAPGLHFYTLNRSTATREIYAALGLGGG